HQFTGRDVDIYVGGQLISTCDRYLELLPEFPLAVQNFAKHQPLFWDERVYPRLRPLPQAPLEPGDHPVIVLTDDWEDFWQRPEVQTQAWTVLFSEDREGSALSEAEGLALQRQIPRVVTETYLLAEHSDGRNTVQFIHNVRPQHIIFVHGSVTDISDLTGLEELQSRYQLHSPTPNTLVELPIGEKFMESSLPLVANYEGEVNELASTVVITLSD
ncbi:MAG: MBL fold metallo-hydrolase, partial [Microcystaceae cyanobacterium]